jgi:DNA-binding LacI/PurR family transcriptional regulator
VRGFDDVVLADALGLTTIRQPAIDLGVRATELLMAQIERFAGGERLVPVEPERLPVELIVRTTTGTPVSRTRTA